jgi:hypothetical protein
MSHHLVHLRVETFVKNVAQKEGHETVDAGSMIGFVLAKERDEYHLSEICFKQI